MSSTYRRICLSHKPPLVIDEEWHDGRYVKDVAPVRPDGHECCEIGVGRWSGALVEIWLPARYYDKDGWHDGEWYDVSWTRRFPQALGLVET